MITLRENQTEPINKAIQFFTEKKPKPSLIVLPTAWGKSILTAFVAKNSNDKMIVLQPSKELLEQNYLKYCSLCGDFALNAGIYSRCVELEDEPHYILSCKYSESAKTPNGRELSDITGQNKFFNMRAYLFWAVRDWLNPRNNTGAMLPPDDKFDEEATEIKFSVKSNGKLYIEPKEDIKERLGRSPDKFDALANTFYPVRYAKPINVNRIAKMIRR